ncbi:hypothetical protein F5X68DRAFT_240895 [Plectosphaerella plurivora]|uniref:Uncharacterized protein n=1 Tax=Plectosphaerella plurivora TaxID=936078 RepID=A0A9P8V9S7_9PEZI|nr:hypothetical protein F5X68DRAFT_240895 [Plectosphaerella plurivora]
MSKTWFLPPDFNFLPDGELRLGTIIKHPNRPTLALASPGPETPEVTLPEIKTLTETSHAHSNQSSRSIGVNIFAKALELASASGSVNVSRYKSLSFGTADHEVRFFSPPPSPEALAAILRLGAVRKYMEGGPLGRVRRTPVYLISGLRVVRDSLAVKSAGGTTTEIAGEAGVSAAAMGVPVPLEVGAGSSVSKGREWSHEYSTAPGIVFAYRLHVIRSRGDGAESELHSEKTAFMTGDGEESEDEMEAVEVTAAEVGAGDLDVEQYSVGEAELVVFKG